MGEVDHSCQMSVAAIMSWQPRKKYRLYWAQAAMEDEQGRTLAGGFYLGHRVEMLDIDTFEADLCDKGRASLPGLHVNDQAR